MAKLDYDYLSSLVVEVQSGNLDAFTELYTITYQKQYRFACQFLKDPHLAQDIVQELYILVLKRIHTLKNPKLFISWLNQINFHLCFDMKEKTNQEQKELLLDDSKFVFSHPHNDIESPLELYYRNQAIFEQIQALPSKETQIILMRFYNGMTLDDIALAMDCSKSTVKRYLKKSYEKLRKALGITSN